MAFTRTMNSRYTPNVGNVPAFGTAGTWTHSYQWSIDSVTVTGGGNHFPLPGSYNVNYPDGRRINFANRSPLPSGNTDIDFRGPLGVRDRFEQLSGSATECYVRLPDGGRIWFHANVTTSGTTATYAFVLRGIIDPYGQITNVSYSGNVTTVTEPAGRWIQIVNRNATSSEGLTADIVVDHITGSDGRTVYYYYAPYTTANGTHYTSLTTVRYFADATFDATYTYQPGNTDPNTRPLISTCTDPMYNGPMWKIAYDFKPNGTNGDGSTVPYGQIWHEKHPNGTIVSTLTVNAPGSRMETRGDGPSRTFTYNTYRLKTSTDFKGVVASQDYDNNYYLQAVHDRNGNTTSYSSNELNGGIKQITYPSTGIASYNYGGQNCADPDNQDQYNKYWLCQDGDGTIYNRDTNKQVIKATHSYIATAPLLFSTVTWKESFTYNNFGQVLSHTLSDSGADAGTSENYTYDGSGRPTAYWDATHAGPCSSNRVVSVRFLRSCRRNNRRTWHHIW